MAVVVLAGALVVGGAKEPTRTEAQQQVVIVGPGGQVATDQEIALLRQDIRAQKQQLIGKNLSLSDAEAEKFWPIYNHYTEELKGVYDLKFGLIKNYTQDWETMTDQDALIYIRRWMEVDEQVQTLRLKYVPVVSQVLPGKKAATFFQLDRRITTLIDILLSSQIPLAHVKE
jgi:hypothetical protein